MKSKSNSNMARNTTLGSIFLFLILCIIFFVGCEVKQASAVPTGPGSMGIIANETKVASNATEINISGGHIATINLTVTQQNSRWKAFVGNVTGKFTLDDSAGSTIYDWTLASITGRVFATRNSSTISWPHINCSTNATLEVENAAMNQTNAFDNITFTFRQRDHASFFVGAVQILADNCPSLHTYINSATQSSDFEEVALNDWSSNVTVYGTIMENDLGGFDGGQYDFQMLVPENGAPGYTGYTPYYLYVELD